MASFFEVSGPTVAVRSPKRGYFSAETPYFDFELLFLVASATRVEIESQKCFCTTFYGEVWTKTTKTVLTGFIPRKDPRS